MAYRSRVTTGGDSFLVVYGLAIYSTRWDFPDHRDHRIVGDSGKQSSSWRCDPRCYIYRTLWRLSISRTTVMFCDQVRILRGSYGALFACIRIDFGSHYCGVPQEGIGQIADLELTQVSSFYLKLR